jgi:hypothetical protein
MSQKNWANEDGLPRNQPEHENRHRKKATKKPWKIEMRYTGPCRWPWQSNEWTRGYGAYATEKARDQGLALLQKKAANNEPGHRNYEYRAKT